ncbi:MAG: hypothetical protein ABJF10_24950 [Chthoniobacter sp.]|uniref:hypothetical protein n=1 Tax=Chthoniobacter sp. TaxID=2510640 RepID=UPI0032AE08D2
MHLRPFLALSCLVTSAAFAADLPAIPKDSIAKKKELLFSDDFQGATLDAKWHKVVDTFAVENGTLKGTQTRDQNIPAADGKPEVKAHAAVYGLELPTKDSVIEVKIRFEGNTMMDVEFDDRKFEGSHYGHLCRAQVRLDKQQVTILDERDGTQSNALIELRKDATANKDAINKLVSTHSATFPVPTPLEAGKWYTLVVETVGEAMRVTIDGAPVAYFTSPGIGHATKSKIELGVQGKSGLFDEIKVWNAEPAK